MTDGKTGDLCPCRTSGRISRRGFVGGLAAAAIATESMLNAVTRVQGAPASTCCAYTAGYGLPQSGSPTALAGFLSSEHLAYDLDGWFFFGELDEGVGTRAVARRNGFFIAVQRIDTTVLGYRVPVVPAIVGFDSPTTGGYLFGGTASLDIAPLVTVSQHPWKVQVIYAGKKGSPANTITMSLVQGQMGAMGAVYRLGCSLADQKGGHLEASVTIRDVMGAVNQGYGPASFFPQWILPAQRAAIKGKYGDLVGRYLAHSDDLMTCQGSYYYSAPLLQVTDFRIRRNGKVISAGTRGTLWMDYVVQSYNAAAQPVVAGSSWLFFALQFPRELRAMTLLQLDTKTAGQQRVATLFSRPGAQQRSGALKAAHRWPLDGIHITPVPSSRWTSPASGQQYALGYEVRLEGKRQAHLTIRMVRQNQEIVIPGSSNRPRTVKYEGIAHVQGTMDGHAIDGLAWAELQPIGHL